MLKAAIILILGFILFLLIFLIISPTCEPNIAITTAKNTLPIWKFDVGRKFQISHKNKLKNNPNIMDMIIEFINIKNVAV